MLSSIRNLLYSLSRLPGLGFLEPIYRSLTDAQHSADRAKHQVHRAKYNAQQVQQSAQKVQQHMSDHKKTGTEG